jgi:hypothetical protein
MNHARIAALERQFQLDDDLEFDAQVREASQLRRWVVEQGFGTDYEPDFHAALAASLKTPER